MNTEPLNSEPRDASPAAGTVSPLAETTPLTPPPPEPAGFGGSGVPAQDPAPASAGSTGRDPAASDPAAPDPAAPNPTAPDSTACGRPATPGATPVRSGPRTGPIVWGALILAFCAYVAQLTFGSGPLDTTAWIILTVLGLGVLLLGVGLAVIIRNGRARK